MKRAAFCLMTACAVWCVGSLATAQQAVRFEDTSEKLGIAQIMKGWALGHGGCWGDADGDGRPDLYVGAFSSARMYDGADAPYPCLLMLNKPGGFALPDDKTLLLAGQRPRLSGGIFADLDNDGDLDLVAGMHVLKGAFQFPTKLYENLGGGRFKDSTPAEEYWPSTRGVRNVAALDLNNDGLLDLIFADGSYGRGVIKHLYVLENQGNKDGVPQFSRPPNESLIGYYAAAPVADYDQDGRVDMFMVPYFTKTPPYLFRNVSQGGHWLTVKVAGKGPGLNPMGIGSVVRAYKPGMLGQADGLIARYDIVVGTGYSSGEEALAHLGLGENRTVDVEVTWGQRHVTKTGVGADQALTIAVKGK